MIPSRSGDDPLKRKAPALTGASLDTNKLKVAYLNPQRNQDDSFRLAQIALSRDEFHEWLSYGKETLPA